jgi:hypothetical protein
MNTPSLRIASLAGLAAFAPAAVIAQVSLTDTSAYTQAFTTGSNGVSSGTQINTAGIYTWTDNSSITGWFAVVNGSTATQYRASNTAAGQGDTGIYLARASGTSGALASLRSSSNTGFTAFGVQLANNTGSTISNFAVSYLGQQWQDNTGGVDTLTFQYSTDATSLTTGSWTTVSALSFSSLQDSNTGSNFISLTPTGSSVAPGTTVSSSITGLSLANGSNIWFRWVDENNTGVDDALSIDNLSITPTLSSVPEPSAYAMLAGLAMLGAATLRRRSRHV